MTSTRPFEQVEYLESRRNEELCDRIGAQVLGATGRPPNLLRAQVRPLWGRYYRVNVLVGADAGCATVGRSFFVEANDEGRIVASTPEFTKVV